MPESPISEVMDLNLGTWEYFWIHSWRPRETEAMSMLVN